MTKARFSTKQPAVRVTSVGNLIQFQLCLNEAEVTDASMDEQSEPVMEYEYDYNEFRTDALSEDEVKANPGKYIDYVPVDDLAEPAKTETMESRISSLESAVQDVIMSTMEE